MQGMKTVSLEALFQTESLGPILLGMSRAQVQEALGPSDEVGCTSRKYRRPSCWFYGDIELHFVRGGDELWLIHLEHFRIPQGGKNLHLDPWIIRGEMTRSEVEHHLAACSLPFQQIPSAADNATTLRVGAGITLLFLNELRPHDPPPGLFALSFRKE
jgi:hypothetical protein